MKTAYKLLFSILIIVSACQNKSTSITTVGVLDLGQVDKSLNDTVINAIRASYGFKIIDLGKKTIPKNYFINVKSPRYRADSIIHYLKTIKPDSIDYIVGLTAFDISTTKRDAKGNILKPEHKYTDWGIFGLGYVPGPSCVVSSHRLKTNNKNLFYSRIKKVVIHELGHNLGLPHCKNKNCIMTDAVEKISTIDNEGQDLCDDCRKQIN